MNKYTGTVRYIDCPHLFDGRPVTFSVNDNDAPAKASPGSPVYTRAQRDFDQATYMYPAPPLYLGQQDIPLPDGQLYILRLLIKQPGSDFVIPDTIAQMQPFIANCATYQKAHFPDFEDRFVYLTVRSGPLLSNREDEFHADGFQGISVPRHIPEQNYIWCDKFPTLFAMQPYFVEDLDPAVHNFHSYFNAHTDRNNVYAVRERGTYIMDPFHVHARQTMPEDTERAFIRLTFSPVEIRDDTNMVNKWLPRGPYNRNDIRNRLVDYEGPPPEAAQGLQRVALAL